MRFLLSAIVGAIIMAATANAAVVLHDRTAVEVDKTLLDPTDLWVTADDLPRVNGFTLKPEGLCYEDICIPVSGAQRDLVVEKDGAQWVNVTGLAKAVGQAVVADTSTGVWSLGEVPAQMQSTLGAGVAPDFTLTDRYGNDVILSDYRGKKVLLITWASW